MVTTALRASFDYVRRNPLALVTVAREAARMRLVVPLDAVRWGLGKIRSDKLTEVAVHAEGPGLGFSLVVAVMGNKLRVGGTVRIDEITAGPGTLRVEMRLHDLAVKPLDAAAGGPIQALLSSGAIDLSKPGNLVSFLPKRPAILAEAEGDRFVLDLTQLRKLSENARVQKILGLITPVLAIREVEAVGDDLIIGLRVSPLGLPAALASLRM
jgi:hypothetical protein